MATKGHKQEHFLLPLPLLHPYIFHRGIPGEKSDVVLDPTEVGRNVSLIEENFLMSKSILLTNRKISNVSR